MFPPGSDKFDMLEFEVSRTDEYLPRAEIERVLAQGSPTMNKSPKMSRTPAKKAMQKMQQETPSLSDFPQAPVNQYGITSAVMQYLEVRQKNMRQTLQQRWELTDMQQIGETFFFMRDLMDYSQKNELRPNDALNQMMTQFDDQQQMAQQGQQGQQGQPGQFNQPSNMGAGQMQQPNHAQMALQRNGMVQGFPPGSGTPSQGHMQLPGQQANFSSPSVPNMNLPMHMNGQMVMNGSPHIGHPGLPGGLAPGHNMHLGQTHTPSPAQSHMAAPPMMPQHSAQGTNSSVASANTSPNVTGKRRRSQVKLENDDGMEPASQRIKASPRVGGKKGK